MKIVLLTCFLFHCLFSFSQVTIDSTLEFNGQVDQSIEIIHPIGKHGFFTYARLNEGERNRYRLSFFSAQFEKIKSIDFDWDLKAKNHRILANADSSEFTFIFSSRSEWILETFHLRDASFSEKIYKVTARVDPIYFQQIKNKIFAVDYKQQNKVLILDMETGTSKMLLIPGMTTTGSVEFFKTDPLGERIGIFFKKEKDKHSSMSVIFLSADGTFSNPCSLEKNSDFSILNGKITRLDKTGFLLSGVYGTDHKSNKPAGFYISKWENNIQQFITYHSFDQFKDFTKFLPSAEKIGKKGRNEPDIDELNYFFHPVSTTKDGFRIVAEAFYPTYRLEYSWGNNIDGEMTKDAYEVFDGHILTHAAVLEVDLKGNKLKDYSIPVDLYYKPDYLDLHLRICESTEEKLKIMYAGSNNKLKSIDLIAGEAVVTTIGEFGEKIYSERRAPSYVRCEYWYDNVYLAYSSEEIEPDDNDSKKEKKNRPTVTLINKVYFQE